MMLTALVLTCSAALAASTHFKKGGEPVCTFSGSTSIPVTCGSTAAGLGNDDLNIHLSVSGFSLYQCQKGGGNTAPGQNRVLEGPATPWQLSAIAVRACGRISPVQRRAWPAAEC